MRVERPPADEIPPPPAYLEASVRRPTAGIGPEARLAGLDERTELRIIVPRWGVNMHCTSCSQQTLSQFDLDPIADFDRDEFKQRSWATLHHILLSYTQILGTTVVRINRNLAS